MLAADLGFNTERVLTVDVRLPEERYQTAASRDQFFTQMREAVRPLEGVRTVALAMGAPPRGGMIFGQLETRDGKALFETSASDPWTLATTAAVLPLAALLAAWLPAQRAMRVEPMVAMRVE